MLVSFSYCDNIIWFFFGFLFNLCKYLRIYGLKVVNITEFLILILKVVRLIVTIVSISIIYYLLLLLLLWYFYFIKVLVHERGLCKYFVNRFSYYYYYYYYCGRFYLLLFMSLLHQPADFKSIFSSY